ncbi:MAG: glycoside hydrolase family 2 protein [Solirubrobacterales bacterium]
MAHDSGKRAIAGVAVLLAFALTAPPSSAGVSGGPGAGPSSGSGGSPDSGLGPSGSLGEGPSGAPGPGGGMALTHWTLRRDPADLGLLRGWSAGGFAGTEVSVPNVVNPAPLMGRGAIASYEGSVAWYRTSLMAPTAGTYAVDLQSANYLAEAWIDGRPLGSHIGFYLPFELRAALAAGPHTLVVRVDWRDPLLQTREGFHRTWFNFGGLNGAVSVREIGASELSDPTIQTTLAPDTPEARQATVRLSVAVRNDGPARAIAPEGTLSRAGRTIPVSFPAQLVGAEETVRMSATVTVPEPALWSPAGPNLYELTLAVAGESSYSARVGLRELTWGAGRMHLDGEPLNLHGASIQTEARGHGDALGPAEEDALVRELKAIGANATRSQHPLPAGLLERLDAAGILVWQGVGPNDPSGDWTGVSAALAERAREDVRTAAQADQLHPSIVAWNLANEVAGNGHPGGQARYMEAMSRWLHAYDPGRMVAVDVWGAHPPRHAGPLYRYVDAVSETDYSGWYEGIHGSAGQLRKRIRARLAAMHRTFAGRVQIVSEFGAEANALNPPDRPGGYAFQTRVLARHIALYEADPKLSGMLIWVLRDFALTPTYDGGSVKHSAPHIKLIEGLNGKGLFDWSGRPKPAAAAVAQLFKALPAG